MTKEGKLDFISMLLYIEGDKMAKKWEILNKLKGQSAKLKVEEIIKILLENRGIKTASQKEEFFQPIHPDKLTAEKFGIDPIQLKKTVERIKQAKKSKEKVIVWGDYDADGICGAAILWEALYYSGVNALPFIPERRTEGYGLNIARMKQLKEEDPTVGLIITVDNGIVAHEKVDTAKELGIDVIITDHHLPRQTKPKAYSILHTVSISGAGVAYLLARELKIENLKLKIADDWLGLAALATIADMIPLVGVARSLVYHGLPVLQRTKRLGIMALFEVAGRPQKDLGTYDIGFILAPRLNAMGRLENALDSLRLLCTKNSAQARLLAQRLNQTNIQRQQMVVEAWTHAQTQVDGQKLIFVAHETYHEGIVGLVASRLVEQFNRPAMVIAKGAELSRGSARSITGFNIVELLEKGREFLVEGGGHPMAAGFTVKTESISLLAEVLQKETVNILTEEISLPKLKIDCEIPLESVNEKLTREVMKFAPFGIGNPEPVFATCGVMVDDARLVGGDRQHLKLTISQEPNSLTAQQPMEAIGFGMGEMCGKLSPDKKVDIAYTVGIDTWSGNKRLQLKLRDIQVK
ncbi:single-stranded-DNA-specific exonuclease RecJ [Candidatus Microgenomates bacterium]|nr:single-stranded-DNA-specific exonuclease RecJ [Candidatus Microgenomates bacterium]